MKRLKKNSFIRLCLSMTFFIDLSSTAEFGYSFIDIWPQIYPDCGGQRQSPISWELTDIVEEDVNDYFTFVNFNYKPLSAKLSNIGVGLKVSFEWDETQRPLLTGGILGDNEYVLDSWLFHWNRVSEDGSEHCPGSPCSPIELQILHYNRKYGSFNNSLNFTDGLVIYSGSIEYKETNRGASSPPLSYIFSQAGSVNASGSSIALEPFAISSLRNKQDRGFGYLAYLGSLTMPPCTENVLWLLAIEDFYVHREEIDFLRSTVKFDFFDQDNIRPVQPLNGRTLTLLFGLGDFTL